MAKLIWTEKATTSLEDIAEFIERDSLYYAKKTVEDIYNLTQTLKTFPNIGKTVQEYENDESIRQLFYKTYRIIYKIENNNVFILTIISCYHDLTGFKL